MISPARDMPSPRPGTRAAETAGARAAGMAGVVSSGHRLASEAAVAVLEDGGNAVDAAVAAGLVLCVVTPYACSLGGDAYLLVYDGPGGRLHGLNGTGTAPALSERLYGGIPPDGALSVSTPGLVAAFADALSRFGTRRLDALLGPAIAAAEDGFAVHDGLVENIRNRTALLTRDATAAGLFLPGGRPPARGACFRQPDLAGTLRLLQRDGADAFYRGEIARRIAADMRRRDGLLSEADLVAHRSLWQEPVSAPAFGHEVVTMPPNSFGLTLLLQLLEMERRMADGGGLPGEADFILAGIRARQGAYAACSGVIGDPGLLEEPAREILARWIAGSGRPGAAAGATEPRDRDTTNVVVADAHGNWVSLIQSISAPFGAGLVAGDTGIVLNNRMRGFVTDRDSPNAVAPGRRPAHTLAPCIVLRDGRPAMAIGTPGATGQTCTIAQFVARVLGRGETVADAIEAPRWSVDLKGRPIVETTLDPQVVEDIGAGGIAAASMARGWQTFGSLKVVVAGADGIAGHADTRREAFALAARPPRGTD